VSDRLSPGPDAKARFQALGDKGCLAFFDEIPAPAMQSVAKYLPSVAGFRKTSSAGIIKQKAALARNICKATANDRDFNALYLIWRTWIDAHFVKPKAIHEAMDKLEKAADKAAGNDARRLVVEQQTDIFLKTLKEESVQNRCTREQIERLFTFSPLPETPTARGLIAGAKNAADVDRDAALSELPKRLQKDEDDIERIKSELKTLSERVDQTQPSIEAFPTSVDRLHASIEEAKAIALRALDAVEALSKISQAIEEAPRDAPTQGTATDIRIEALAIAVESRRGEIRALDAKLEDVDTLLSAIAEIEGAQKSVERTLHQHGERVGVLGATVDDLKLAGRQQEPAITEHLGLIDKRLTELEQRPLVSVPIPIPANEPPAIPARSFDARQRHSAVLRWDSLVPAGAITETALQSHTELARGLSVALQSLGLKKSAAQIFSEECAATVVAKQAIFLKGSFATQTARAFARVIGGTSSARIAIPIGLQDGEELRAAVEAAFQTDRSCLHALVLEGINRTALDITREVLVDCLEPGFERAPSRSAVVATISEGVASIPVEPGYFEIGPVFDLNCLDWRVGQPPGTGDVPSAFSHDAHKVSAALLGNVTVDVEEASRLASVFISTPNPSIERAFAQAHRALHVVRSDTKAVTSIQSLFFGWLMPYWFALGITKDQIEVELDGGKVNGTTIDLRLTAMAKAANLPGGAA
jgi:hypothetical protein